MNCFPPELRKKIAQAGHDDLAAKLEMLHTKLLMARLPFVRTGEAQTEIQLYFGLSLVIWQVQLHRAERLLVSCGACIANDDAYGLASLSRSFVESTAVLTAVSQEMNRLAAGKSTIERFGDTLLSALIGTRLPINQEPVKAVNILTYLEKADCLIHERNADSGISLSRIYDRLSEYAHPNIDSNMVGFDLKGGIFTFEHKSEISPRHVAMLRDLVTAAVVFESVSTTFKEMLKAMFSMSSAEA